MNPQKKRWITLIATSVVLALGLGALIYFQQEDIEKSRQEADSLRQQITAHRELIKGTPDLVKKVIIQRETDAVIQEILSNEKDVLDFTKTLHKFAEESDVKITSLKPQRAVGNVRGGRKDFERVGYSISFDGDGFHLLSFLNRVETHRRFMSVTAFKLQAASRNEYEKEQVPRHRITMDIETYVYTPTAEAKQVKIDQYERKRDLLVSEISKRAAELRFTPYDYRGQRGRRDPWIDPRVAVDVDGQKPIPIEEQLSMVAELVDRAHQAELLFEQMKQAEDVISEMKARAKLEEDLAALREDILRIQDADRLNYIIARKRFDNQVVAVVDRLMESIETGTVEAGPSLTLLTETMESMEERIRLRQYEEALAVYATVENRLEQAEGEERLAVVQVIQDLKLLAETVIEFESIRIDIAGIALHQGYRPVALINGQAVVEGDLVGNELIVRSIGPEQIEFAFRGLVLARLVAPDPQPN